MLGKERPTKAETGRSLSSKTPFVISPRWQCILSRGIANHSDLLCGLSVVLSGWGGTCSPVLSLPSPEKRRGHGGARGRWLFLLTLHSASVHLEEGTFREWIPNEHNSYFFLSLDDYTLNPTLLWLWHENMHLDNWVAWNSNFVFTQRTGSSPALTLPVNIVFSFLKTPIETEYRKFPLTGYHSL